MFFVRLVARGVERYVRGMGSVSRINFSESCIVGSGGPSISGIIYRGKRMGLSRVGTSNRGV